MNNGYRTIVLDEETYNKIKFNAFLKGITVTKYANEFFKNYIDRKKQNGK